MADVPERQARQLAFVPEAPRDLFSADQHQYADAVPVMQQAKARDANFNGADAERRYTGD